MPSASTSTLSSPSASRSSLSHWITVRSGIAAFSTGTSSASGPREMTKPPTCCERWRGKPRSVPASRAPSSVELVARAWQLVRIPPGEAPSPARSTSSSRKPSALPTSRTALRGAVADHRGGERGALAAVLARRRTGSPPRAAGARSRRRCRAARCAPCETKRSNSMLMRAGSTSVMPRRSTPPSSPPSRAPGRGCPRSRAKRTMSCTVRKNGS